MQSKLSERKIKERIRKKTNPALVELAREMKMHNGWHEVRKVLVSSTRKIPSLNLDEIDKKTKEGDTIVIPGKVLSKGDVTKKIRICALGFSEGAREKLKKHKSEIVMLMEEVKKNPKAQGVKVLR